ncbi:MAG: L-aspartate oxidase [Methylococcales bacterium]
MPQLHTHDILIIGTGAAGLSTALRLADHAKIAILAKKTANEGSTYYAQGGIAAVVNHQDSINAHINDTLTAGADLCDETTVRLVVEQGKECIDWLLEKGMPFSTEKNVKGENVLHLNREGGHSHRRIAHVADTTGQSLSNTLEDQVQQHPNIEIFEHHHAIDLITAKKLGEPSQKVVGCYVYDALQHQVKTFAAEAVVLATGGASKVYLYTSNPDIATGDGIALAWRAGCRVVNMEFIQFHPTCLYHPEARSFLISEAVRGEGGKLLLPDGSSFMHRFDSREELAPRDIVARAIDHEIKRLGVDCLYLDISHKSSAFIKDHFPMIFDKCLQWNIDITQQPIPIVPAAHFTCGGIMIDHNACTDIPGLYAVGETSFTGLHGANRLASNSLLECLVFSKQASKHLIANLKKTDPPESLPFWDESQVSDSDEEVVVSHNWDEVRRFMWDYVGIVRTNKRLQRANHRVELLKQEINEYYRHFRVTADLLELRNLVIVADLIIQSALLRKESRGLHYTRDYPSPDTSQPPRNTVLEPTTTHVNIGALSRDDDNRRSGTRS